MYWWEIVGIMLLSFTILGAVMYFGSNSSEDDR